MFGILDRYVGRSVLMSILLCTLMLVGLSALIKYVEQMKSVGAGSYDAIAAGWYVLYSIPKELVLFFPIGALLVEGVKNYLFVEREPGVFEKREVTLAVQTRSYAYVWNGVKGGDKVVGVGALLLNAELASSSR